MGSSLGGDLDRGRLPGRRGGRDEALRELALGGEQLAVEVERRLDEFLRRGEGVGDGDRGKLRGRRLDGLRPALDDLDGGRLALADRGEGPVLGGEDVLGDGRGHRVLLWFGGDRFAAAAHYSTQRVLWQAAFARCPRPYFSST